MMEYNTCKLCGANNGRAGVLIRTEKHDEACINCHDTIESGQVVIHANLVRTTEEINKTINLLSDTTKSGKWVDSKGRIVLIHTMSNRWLNNIRKSVKDKEKKAPIIAELKRRKNLNNKNQGR